MIIGLVGRHIATNGYKTTGAGKSVVASILSKNYHFQEISFADPLKRFCMEVLGFSEEQLWGPSEMRDTPNEQGVTAREALRTLGDQWGRGLDKNIWARYLVDCAESVLNGHASYSPKRGLEPPFMPPHLNRKPAGIVVSDVRYKNEVEYLKRRGGKIIVIDRSVEHPFSDIPTHQSEVDLVDMPQSTWDFFIHNDSTIDVLHVCVEHALERLL